MSDNTQKRYFRINPVLLKELKVKMRSWKAAILIGAYNLVLLLLTIFIMRLTMNNNIGVPTRSTILGTYAFLVAAQFGLIILIAPALTAGAISSEREKQTLDILLSTTLKHGAIITGKLFSSLSQIILLLASSVPVFSIIFLYGGIGLVQLLQVYLFFIVIAITLGSIGIFFSTFIRKSTAANVLTYSVVVFLLIGTILISVFYIQMVITPQYGSKAYDGTFWVFNLNPGMALISLVMDQFQQGSGRILPGLTLTVQQGKLHLWHINVLFDVGLSAVLLFLSALKLNPVKRKWHKRGNK